MKSLSIAILALSFTLAGCQQQAPTDDGVPKVADYHHPTDAAGKPMSFRDFERAYCMDKPSNQTCTGVKMADRHDNRFGKLPAGY